MKLRTILSVASFAVLTSLPFVANAAPADRGQESHGYQQSNKEGHGYQQPSRDRDDRGSKNDRDDRNRDRNVDRDRDRDRDEHADRSEYFYRDGHRFERHGTWRNGSWIWQIIRCL